MQTIKPIKMQGNAQAMPAWQYEQEVKQARKANKQLRNMKQSRKQMWMNGE